MAVGDIAPETLAALRADGSPEDSQRYATASIFDAMDEKEPDARASALSSVVERSARDREPFHQVWTEAEGFTYGDQWGAYDNLKRAWSPRAPAPSNKVVRLELNHIHPLTQAAVALHCAEPQSWGVAARTSELADEEAAKVGDDLIAYYQEQFDHELLRQMQAQACITSGTCYVMPVWDGAAGRLTQRAVETSPPQFTPEGEFIAPGSKIVTTADGDVQLRFYSTYEVVVETGAKPTRAPMWMAVKETVPISEIMSHPGVSDEAKRRIQTKTPYSDVALRYEAFRQGMSPRTFNQDGYVGYVGQFGFMREGVIVTRLFVRATPGYPMGREYVFCDGVMIYEGDNPRYPSMDQLGEKWPAWPFPIFVFRNYQIEGAWYGQGNATRAIGPQKTLNGSISKELMYVRRLSNSILVKPKGVNFQSTDEVDQVMEVPGSLQPGQVYYLNQPTAPMHLSNMEERMYAVMQKQYQLDDATLGSMPSANAPASAVRQLKQSSIGQRRPIENRWSRTWAQIYSYVLFLLRRHVVEERIIQIVGLNRRTATMAFSRAKLAAGMDVVLYEDYARPRDPGQRAVWAQTLVGMNLADPKNPDERAEMQRLMGAGSLARFSDRLTRHRGKAERENVKLYRGEMVTVAYHENDQEHLAEHYGEMDTEEYEIRTTPLPNDPPEAIQQKFAVRKAFEGHVALHLQQQQAKAGPMMAPPGMTPPAPGGAPPVGQPAEAPPAETPVEAAA